MIDIDKFPTKSNKTSTVKKAANHDRYFPVFQVHKKESFRKVSKWLVNGTKPELNQNHIYCKIKFNNRSNTLAGKNDTYYSVYAVSKKEQ
jgi:hypothetical protein